MYCFIDIPSAEILSTSNSKVICGSDTRIDCILSGHPPSDRVEWQNSVDGQKFFSIDADSDNLLRRRNGIFSHSLLVRKATVNHQQYYRVVASNNIGMCTSNKLFLQVTGSMLFYLFK